MLNGAQHTVKLKRRAKPLPMPMTETKVVEVAKSVEINATKPVPSYVLPEEFHKSNEPKFANVLLEFQNQIMDLPVPAQQLYNQAASSDATTIDFWKDAWIGNIIANKKRFGSFKDHSAGHFFKAFEGKACIIAGAGPSLKENVHLLKERGSLPLVSCLHSFHLMEDNDAHPDFYISLDSGPIILEEISEGGTRTPEEYWALTKHRTLIAYIGSPPELFEKWQGPVYLFNAPLPSQGIMEKIDAVEKFHCFMSTGGNVLGACLYFSRAFLGCCPTAFVGADFCFGYDKRFHAWDSKYDKNLGYVIKGVDVYGNKRLSWQSYMNFKGWFEAIAAQSQQIFINCTEGGCFGSYPEGNWVGIKQTKLAKFLFMYRMHEEVADQMTDPENAVAKVLF